MTLKANSNLTSYEDPRADIGRRIRVCRANQSLSLRKLSAMIGINRTTLNEIELGRGNAGVKTLAKIAAGLDIELIDLFRD